MRDCWLAQELGRVCCSGGLERQLRRLGSDVHVFGHTHINTDKTLNGVRYVQHPLKYPDERQHWISIGREVLGRSRLAPPVRKRSLMLLLAQKYHRGALTGVGERRRDGVLSGGSAAKVLPPMHACYAPHQVLVLSQPC